MTIRTPAAPMPAASKQLKRAHARSGKSESLRTFVKNSKDETIMNLADAWFHNKKSNFSNPPLGIGATRKKKQTQQKKK